MWDNQPLSYYYYHFKFHPTMHRDAWVPSSTLSCIRMPARFGFLIVATVLGSEFPTMKKMETQWYREMIKNFIYIKKKT